MKQNSTVQYTRYYLGGQYEKDIPNTGNIKEKLYLGGDYYSAFAVYQKENGTGSLYYLHRDYLGSITNITNSSGTQVEEYSYDAWGRMRNPVTQIAYNPGSEPTLLFGRGYTGHEHLAVFGLINMNARLYDAVLGRFLSSDPYVQMPDFTQNFNRYSYCLNNPMIYVDESGEIIWFIVGAATGMVAGGIGGGVPSYFQGKNVWTGSDISSGRNALSLNNKPVKSTTHSRPVGSEPSPLTSSLKPDPSLQNDIRSYSVTTQEKNYFSQE